MICPKCHNNIPDTSSICPACNTVITSGINLNKGSASTYPAQEPIGNPYRSSINQGYNTAPPRPQYTPPLMPNNYGYSEMTQTSRNSNGALIAVIAALGVIIIGLVAFMLFYVFKDTDDGGSNDPVSSSVSETAETTLLETTAEETTVMETTTAEAPTTVTEPPVTTPVPTASSPIGAPSDPSPSPTYNSYGVIDPSTYGMTMYSSPEQMHVTCKSVYLYIDAHASIKPAETNVLYEGDNADVWGYVGDMAYVSAYNGNGGNMYGWVPKKYLASGYNAMNTAMYSWTTITVTAGSCYVNSVPAKDTGSALGVAHTGDTFTVIDFDGYWFKVYYGDGYGYVSHKMVTGY